MRQSSLREGRVLYVMAAEQEYGPELRRRVRPLVAGVGVVEAAIGTSLRLKKLSDARTPPDLVISLGSAASRRCAIGTVWQVARVSWRDMDASRLGFERGVIAASRDSSHAPTKWPSE